MSICILLFLIYLFFLILLYIICVFCSVTVILLHCGNFCHENKFLECVNIPGNKAHSDSDSFNCGFVYKQGTIWRRIFRKIKTKRQHCDDYIGSDGNIATSVRNCFHYVITIAVYAWSFDMYWVFMCFWPKWQQRPSVKDEGCQTCY